MTHYLTLLLSSVHFSSSKVLKNDLFIYLLVTNCKRTIELLITFQNIDWGYTRLEAKCCGGSYLTPKMFCTKNEKNRLVKEISNGNITRLQQLKNDNPTFHWSTLKYDQTGDTVLHCAARLGHIDTIDYLLKFTPPAVDCKNNDDKTPLHEAAQFVQAETVGVLLKNGANVNALKRADWTPLMLACTKQDLQTIKLLVENGALINYSNKDGWTSLHLSAREGNGDIFHFLVDNGGDINAKTKNGRSILHISALHGSLAICHYLLNLKVDPNIRDNCGNTPLHEAILGNNIDICKILVNNGANVACRNNVDFNILHLASCEGYNDLIRFIITELHIDINTRNCNGFTALHCASRKNQHITCKLLETFGSDVKCVDNFGRMPSEYLS